MKFSFVLLFMALAAGTPAARQSPQQTPAQTPPVPPLAGQAPGTPAAPPPAVPASRKFTSDSGMIFNVIKPDKTADFEAVLARVKEALGKSQDPKRKQQALSWRVFKSLEAAPGGNVLYVFLFDPAAKDEEYTVSTILAEAFPNEVQDLWAKYTACFVSGQTMVNLQQTLTMSPVGTPK